MSIMLLILAAEKHYLQATHTNACLVKLVPMTQFEIDVQGRLTIMNEGTETSSAYIKIGEVKSALSKICEFLLCVNCLCVKRSVNCQRF